MEEQKFKFELMHGHAEKVFTEMTEEELDKAHAEIGKQVRKKAFDLGLPIYYGEKGLVIAEFSDGRKFVIENLQVVRPYND
jgi:hypothetical protein